jgi:hypothetical protein
MQMIIIKLWTDSGYRMHAGMDTRPFSDIMVYPYFWYFRPAGRNFPYLRGNFRDFA